MAVDRDFYEQTDLWGEDHDLDPQRTDERVTAMTRLLPQRFDSLLDIGTGDGRVLGPMQARLEAADRNPLVIGLDRSATALGHVRTVRTQASADALPYQDASIDVITACEILEHLPDPIFEATRTEMARVAKDSIVITVPNDENRRRADLNCSACGCRYNRRRHLRSFDRDSFDDLLPGFEVSEVMPFGHHTRIYPRRVRQELERRGILSVFDAPSCPQCGQAHGRRASDIDPSMGTTDRRVDPDTGGPEAVERRSGRDRRASAAGYWTMRSLVPAERRPYWLGVRLDRV